MTPRQIDAAYASLAGLLLLILVVEWLPGGAPPRVAPAPAPRNTAASPAARADAGQAAETVLARPLFSTQRRPPRVAQGPKQVVTGGEMPRLAGIIIGQRERRAIFMPETGKPITLVEGSTLDDLRVVAIAPGSVTLEGPKGRTVLRPVYDKSHGGGGGGGSAANPVQLNGLNQGIFNPNLNRPMFPPGMGPGGQPPGTPNLGAPNLGALQQQNTRMPQPDEAPDDGGQPPDQAANNPRDKE